MNGPIGIRSAGLAGSGVPTQGQLEARARMLRRQLFEGRWRVAFPVSAVHD
jgi:hypothetical protein